MNRPLKSQTEAWVGVGIGLLCAAYFGLCIVQLVAIYASLTQGYGFSGIFAGPLALFTAFVPLVGSGAAYLAAMKTGDWSITAALSVFLTNFVISLILLLIVARDMLRKFSQS